VLTSFYEENRAMKSSPRRSVIVLAIALMAGLLMVIYAFSRDKELAGDLMKALFGLSGGVTAGG
jgi:hypothetical protein